MEKIIFLIRKYFFIILKIFLSVFFIPIIILIRMISPLKIIRFGRFLYRFLRHWPALGTAVPAIRWHWPGSGH